MTLSLIHSVDVLLWIVMAASVAYVVFFSLVSLLPARSHSLPSHEKLRRFLVLFPAYNEDNVIRHSITAFLRQDYPQELYQVAVISDHMQAATNRWLAGQPIRLFLPSFQKSSKAQALQYAIAHSQNGYDHVVILDADNVVAPDFLQQLNAVCAYNYQAIQCHRTAKNNDNGIAALDGASEEINNSIFRLAHNRIGLSSALIGSGMCFSYQWFRDNVNQLNTAGEDRELEAMLLRQHIHIHYAEHIYVMDEKVSSGDNFQRQRMRWMTAQVQCLLAMLPYLPRALRSGNVDYIDKTLQQALIPRSILLLLLTFMSVLTLLLHPACSMKWWGLLAALVTAIVVAIPRQLRSRTLFSKVLLVPQLAWRMLANVVHIDTRNKDFIHTTHDK